MHRRDPGGSLSGIDYFLGCGLCAAADIWELQ